MARDLWLTIQNFSTWRDTECINFDFCINQNLTAVLITQPWLSPLNIQVKPFNRKKMRYDHLG